MSAAHATLRCLVLGAASGIGKAVAERLEPIVRELVTVDLPGTSAPTAARHLHADVTDVASVDAAVAAAVSRMGGLDAVVNTAGILGRVQSSLDERVEDFERLLRVNLTGAFIVSRAVLLPMLEGGFGRLVHFASTAGKEGVAGMTGYSAAKAGVMGMVKALAREHASSGVTVNAIAPGKVQTPLVGNEPPSDADLSRIPIGRLGTPEEAAALVEYVISPEASYTTGVVFDLSGGRASF